MADFGGGNNPEVDGGVGQVREVSKEQVEQFQEQLKAAQAALAKLQKEEGKAKKRDNALASLLSRFVKGNIDPEILKLIVICLSYNIPVSFIIGILSLHYEEIYQEVARQFNKEPVPVLNQSEEKFLDKVEQEESKDLEPRQEFDEHKLPEAVKKRVNEWVRDILLLSLENIERTLENGYPEQQPDPSALQLTTKVLEKYLLSVSIEGSFERIKAFAEFVLKGIGRELQKVKK